MRRDIRAYLYDIREACDLILAFISGKSFADYTEDPLLRSGVERQLMTAGEALHQLLRIEPDLGRLVHRSRSIIGLRNVLVHGYAYIDNATIWDIVENKLPSLRLEVDALLRQKGTPQES